MAKRARRRKRPRRLLTPLRLLALMAVGAIVLLWVVSRGGARGPVELVRIPPGSSFAQVADSLAAHRVVRAPILFRLWAHLTGDANRVKPGTYGLRRGSAWTDVLRELKLGRVLNARLIVPEGFTLPRIAARLAAITGLTEDSVLTVLKSPATVQRFGVPGPTMEGYLYPATYEWPRGTPLDSMLTSLVRRYQRAWTPERLARAAAASMTERDVVTLASIIEAEAKLPEDMPVISAVYHNRLRIGMPLQADPTVQYALRVRKDRLLYADIRGVAEHPYNTYTHRGLPPGPIGCPSERAIDAAIEPARAPYLYFVSQPDGRNIFSRSLLEHNRAKLRVRALARAESAAAAAAGRTPSAAPPSGTAPGMAPSTSPAPRGRAGGR